MRNPTFQYTHKMGKVSCASAQARQHIRFLLPFIIINPVSFFIES